MAPLTANSPQPNPLASALRRTDSTVALLLFFSTLLYLSRWPYNLGSSDEGLFLYEAKRLLDGEVFYRDIFDIITPGSHYLMAGLFGLFGTTMSTARSANAVIHACIVVLTYAAGRAVGLRPALASVPPLAHLALCQAPWPFASPHWVATGLTLSAMVLAMRETWRQRPVAAATLGAVVGLLILVQQQKGVLIALAVNCLAVVPPRGSGSLRLRPLLFYLNAGLIVVAATGLLFLIAQAGFRSVSYALVEHTLINYRAHHDAAWGSVQPATADLAAYTLPTFLKYLPFVHAVVAIRLWIAWRAGTLDRAMPLFVLLVFGLFSAVSILYFPDFIHIGFIATLFFVALIETASCLMPRIVGGGHWASLALALGLVAALGIQLGRNLRRSQSDLAISFETAFGRLDFPNRNEPQLVETADRLLASQPARELFAYPFFSSLYLMTASNNPTPYQLLYPRYSGQAQIQEVIGILERRRVPLVFAFQAFLPKDDALLGYLRQHYEPADEHQIFWKRRAE